MLYNELSLKERKVIRDRAGKCQICLFTPNKYPYKKGKLCLDHCHKTGLVRGVLCDKCNGWLGAIENTFDRSDAKSHKKMLKLQRKLERFGMSFEDFFKYLRET